MMLNLDTSTTQVDQATTPDQVHVPSEDPHLPSEDDSVMERNDAGLACENGEEGDMPLHVRYCAAIAVESQEKQASSCAWPHHWNSTDSKCALIYVFCRGRLTPS
jgi:hypothetical protein